MSSSNSNIKKREFSEIKSVTCSDEQNKKITDTGDFSLNNKIEKMLADQKHLKNIEILCKLSTASEHRNYNEYLVLVEIDAHPSSLFVEVKSSDVVDLDSIIENGMKTYSTSYMCVLNQIQNTNVQLRPQMKFKNDVDISLLKNTTVKKYNILLQSDEEVCCRYIMN